MESSTALPTGSSLTVGCAPRCSSAARCKRLRSQAKCKPCRNRERWCSCSLERRRWRCFASGANGRKAIGQDLGWFSRKVIPFPTLSIKRPLIDTGTGSPAATPTWARTKDSRSGQSEPEKDHPYCVLTDRNRIISNRPFLALVVIAVSERPTHEKGPDGRGLVGATHRRSSAGRNSSLTLSGTSSGLTPASHAGMRDLCGGYSAPSAPTPRPLCR